MRISKIVKEYTILIIIGVLTGALVALFDKALEYTLGLLDFLLNISRLLIFLIAPVSLLIAYLIVVRFAEIKETGSGTHQILDALYTHNGYIHPKDTVTKVIASLLTLGLGGSAGPEGPSMLLGNGIGSYISRKFRLGIDEARKFSLAGAAAGIAAVFRAPLTGMLFALEIPFRKDMETEALIEAAIASVASYLTFVAIAGSAKLFRVVIPVFELNIYHLLNSFILGIITGLLALVFIISYRYIGRLSKTLSRLVYPYGFTIPIIGGLIISLFAFITPEVVGPGYRIIKGLIYGYGRLPLLTLLMILLFKMFVTEVTLSFGGSGGIFVPTLAVGALIGYIYGVLIHSDNIEMLIAVGMASLLAATNKAPFTSVALVAETVGPASIIPTLIATVISYLLTGYYSFYEIQLPHRIVEEELALSEIYLKVVKLRPDILYKIKAHHVMTPKPIYLDGNSTVEDALARVSHYKFRVYPVVRNNILIGYVTIEDLLGIPEEDIKIRVYRLARDPITISPDASLKEVIDTMLENEADHLLVTDKEGKLIGIIADIDVIRTLLDSASRFFRVFMEGKKG